VGGDPAPGGDVGEARGGTRTVLSADRDTHERQQTTGSPGQHGTAHTSRAGAGERVYLIRVIYYISQLSSRFAIIILYLLYYGNNLNYATVYG
jgi:hypothetical protein